MQERIIIRKNTGSQQIMGTDISMDGYIEPFLDFNALLALYYANVYHRRAIKLKAGLLSQVDTTALDKHTPPGVSAKQLLFAFALDAEIYGNAFIEQSGVASNFSLYHLPGFEGRIDRERQLFQLDSTGQSQRLEGHHFKYHSPASRWYGEPDYLATVLQILTTQKADRYNDVFFDNGARPDMAIIYENGEPSEAQLESFRTFFGSSFKGYDKAHKTLILSSDSVGDKDAKIRFEQLGKVEEMSHKQLKEVNRDEIVAGHGVPPRLVGIMSAGGLGGGGELIGQLHAFNEVEIKPKIELIEGFFDSIDLPTIIKPLDVTNFKDDSDVVTNLVNSKIITQQEAREILGWQKNLKSGIERV